SVLISLFLMFQFSEVQTNQVQPQAQKTGAPSESTCGEVACHNTNPNTFSGNVSISFSDADNTYIPGQTYQVTVAVTETGITKFGFECTSLDANNDSAGLWLDATQGDIAYPNIPLNLQRRYVSHHNANSNNTWVINWKATVVDTGC